MNLCLCLCLTPALIEALTSSTDKGFFAQSPSSETRRLQAIRRAARDGLCTTDWEDSAVEAVGGPHASTYGEITPRGFSALGHHLSLSQDDTFLDAGSGLGRAVMQAAREFRVRRAFGIELAASRHRMAIKNLEREPEDVSGRCVLINGDCADPSLWEEELEQCSVVYVANLLFDARLNSRLKRCLENTPTVRAIASLQGWQHGLEGFHVPSEVEVETSWSAPLLVAGGAGAVEPHPGSTVYIYERQDAS